MNSSLQRIAVSTLRQFRPRSSITSEGVVTLIRPFSNASSSSSSSQTATTTNARVGEGMNTNTNNNNNSNRPPSQAATLEGTRTAVLAAALKEVHQYGWTEDAFAAAALKLKSSSLLNSASSLSTIGMLTTDDLIGFCMDQWNIQLKQDLAEEENNNDNNKQSQLSVDQLLLKGLRTRLEYLIPYLESNRWHEGMALGIRGPSNALQTQRQLKEMIDIIVHNANIRDRSNNLGVGEKMALGVVYVATELHLLTGKIRSRICHVVSFSLCIVNGALRPILKLCRLFPWLCRYMEISRKPYA